MSVPEGYDVVERFDNEFEAESAVRALRDAGIEAVAEPSLSGGGPLGSAAPVAVVVPTLHLEAARSVLSSGAGRGGDGEEDVAAPSPRRPMPWPARIAFAAALLVTLVALAAMVIGLFV